MAFTLRVSQGGESEDFSFDGGEARLGRTADNDIVIKDPLSSRSHARIVEEDGAFFVEDLKSANGTKLNSKPIKSKIALENGDKISIGEVVLEFEGQIDAEPPSSTQDDEEDAAEPPSAESAVETDGAAEPDDTHAGARPSAIVRPPAKKGAAASPSYDEDDPEDDATRNFDVPPPKALQRRPASLPGRPAVRSPAPVGNDAGDELTAAERARRRRELQRSSSGRAQLLWGDLSKPAKVAVGFFGALAAAAVVGLGVWAVMPKQVKQRPEVVELTPNGDPLPDSFGLGPNVEFQQPDMKSFTFSYASPTAIVGVLHYQARECSKDEVTLELNGNPLGAVPPDTMDVQRQLEVVLPANRLKLAEPNELVFDNTNNPPGEDTWRIWNVWVEIIPIPQMSGEEASRRAKEDIERASRQYEMRDVGAMNLFRAWKQYRDAWLLLESTPDRQTDLLEIARSRMREIRPELDRKCSAMLVDYQQVINLSEPNKIAARRVLQNIPEHFEKEHPCYGMSRYLLQTLDEMDEVE